MAGTGKQSAFQILIDAGARVTSVSATAADAAAIQERKRQVRTVDVFLSKERGIDTAKTSVERKTSTRLLDAKKAGQPPKTAFQVSMEVHNRDHDVQWLAREMAGVAKRSRTQMRAQKSRINYVYVKEKKDHKQGKRGAMELNAADLASIATEFESGMFDAENDDDGLEEDGLDKEAREYAEDLARIQGEISSDEEFLA